MPTVTLPSEILTFLPTGALHSSLEVRLPSGDLAFTCDSREANSLAQRSMVECVVSHKGHFRYMRLIVTNAKAQGILRLGQSRSISAQDNKTVSRVPTKCGRFFYFEHNSRSGAYARGRDEPIRCQ